MNADRLLQHYGRIADAPDAIARLRRFILDLAVRGKLVPQDPNDEPASELLKRIAKEKTRLVKAGEIRDKPALPSVADPDMPFPVPSTWEWVRFANIVDFSAGRTPSRNDTSFWNNGDHAWVSIADMEDGQVLTATKETVSDKARARVFGSELEAPGTILMSFKLTIGKIARLGIPAFHNEAIISIRPHVAALDGYLFKVLPQFARQGDTKGAIKGATLNRDSISNILLPLPPLAEQYRIVAKVNELMGLCDRLEAARAGREAMRDRLAAASLARLNAPDPETLQADARFALDALPALTTRPDQIKALRQTILNLAVRGKLVPQDSNDEPVSELLTRIAMEKARLIGEKKLKRPKETLPIEMENVPFKVPAGWVWSKADDVFLNITDGFHNTPSPVTEGFPYVTAKHIRPKRIDFENCLYVDAKNHRELTAKTRVKRGDILIVNIGAGCGTPAMVDVDFEFSFKNVAIVNLPSEMDGNFILQFLLYYRDLVFDDLIKGGAQPFLGLGMLREMLIPLPPLVEQHRIVTKLDALMALCDRLEASLTATTATRRRLLDALLAEALAPVDVAEMEAAE